MKPAEYFRDHVLPFNGTLCLSWPYAKTGGYGQISIDGVRLYVHRLVCEHVHGPAPTPEHEAAHSCGNRACANPRHLSWKTPKENHADKLVHGTLPLGSRHHNAKLTEADVRAIRSIGKSKKQSEIAKQFGVHHSNVSLILTGKGWFRQQEQAI